MIVVSGCVDCLPELRPDGPCRGEGHHAVRFDTAPWMTDVRLDGEVIRDCYEVDVDAGMAWRTATDDGHVRHAECGQHPHAFIAFIDEGNYSVRRKVAA